MTVNTAKRTAFRESPALRQADFVRARMAAPVAVRKAVRRADAPKRVPGCEIPASRLPGRAGAYCAGPNTLTGVRRFGSHAHRRAAARVLRAEGGRIRFALATSCCGNVTMTIASDGTTRSPRRTCARAQPAPEWPRTAGLRRPRWLRAPAIPSASDLGWNHLHLDCRGAARLIVVASRYSDEY
jgi:hypothetical protein